MLGSCLLFRCKEHGICAILAIAPGHATVDHGLVHVMRAGEDTSKRTTVAILAREGDADYAMMDQSAQFLLRALAERLP